MCEKYGLFYAVFLFLVVGVSVDLLKEVIARYLLRQEERRIVIACRLIAIAMIKRAHEEKFSGVHDELFYYHHKRRFAQRIHEELLPVAWHPERAWDWCFDEEQKQVAGQLWNWVCFLGGENLESVKLKKREKLTLVGI